jgi:MFS-type transporter involved in bile tolerance (Atg22 family)
LLTALCEQRSRRIPVFVFAVAVAVAFAFAFLVVIPAGDLLLSLPVFLVILSAAKDPCISYLLGVRRDPALRNMSDTNQPQILSSPANAKTLSSRGFSRGVFPHPTRYN